MKTSPLTRTGPFLLVTTLLLGTASAGGKEIEEISLELGRSDANTLSAPVFESGALHLEIGSFDSSFDYSKRIVERLGRSGARSLLSRSVDLGRVFADALRQEGEAMGIEIDGGGDSWSIRGTVRDALVENRQVPFGPLLFFGFLDVEIRVKSPTGAESTARYRLHAETGRYNAGFGVKDEMTEALSQLFVEAAQDALARLNRQFFKANAHGRIEGLVASLSSVKDHENDVRAIGLSGAAGASTHLLTLLPSQKDEGDRVDLVTAIALLGSPDVVSTLIERYPSEDEDVRWATLKALDYIGGEDALAFVASTGTKDDNKACRALAEKISR